MHFKSHRAVGGNTDRVFIELDFSVEQLKSVGPTGMKQKAEFIINNSIDGWAKFFNATDPE